MTADARAAVLTARRAAQHFRLSVPHDAYEYLCILTILPEPRPVSALCWQIHRCLAVSVPLLRVWVHCPRASNGPLPRRSYLVGYAQWDARFIPCLLVKQSVPAAFQVAARDGARGLTALPPSDNHSNSFQFALRVARHPPGIGNGQRSLPLPTTGLVARLAELAAKSRPSSIGRITFGLPVNRPESGLANPGHECYRLFATVIFPPRSTRAGTGI
jgi:hypothetical protein